MPAATMCRQKPTITMKPIFAIICLCFLGFDVHAQTLPGGQPRPLLTYGGDLKEVRINSEAALPQWLAKCDPPFYEVFSIRTLAAAPAFIAVFIGGSAREEVITYTLIPTAIKSCSSISRLGSYTFRRPVPMPNGGYSEIFPILNAKGEVAYLLHEEKSLASGSGGAALTRTLLALTGKSLRQVARVTKTNGDAEQLPDALIPFAALLK